MLRIQAEALTFQAERTLRDLRTTGGVSHR